MSADLFAAFDASFETPKPQQQNTASSAASQFSSSNTDPFLFLQPTPAPVRPQPNHQTTQWADLQHPHQAATGSLWGELTGLDRPGPVAQVAQEEDDGWGDFESAPQNSAPSKRVASNVVQVPSYDAAPTPARVQSQERPTTRVVRASTMDLISNNLLDLGPSPSKLGALAERLSWESSTRPSTESRPKNTDPNVLFDADDFDGEAPPDEDDDFGDFEAPAPAPVQPPGGQMPTGYSGHPLQTRKEPPSQLLSTLTINDGLYPQAPKSPSFQERNPFPGLGLKTPIAEDFPKREKSKSPTPVTAWPTIYKKDDSGKATERNSFEAGWGTFDDVAPTVVQPQVSKPTDTKAPKQTTATKTTEATSDWDWDAWGSTTETPPPPKASSTLPSTASKPSTTGPPPTNIPPPSVLLSIFPSLLSTASTSLFQPTSSAPLGLKDRIHTSPATIRFLRGYVALATVAARIIAGRRLRWHRDKFLAQSMTISAATGGRGGMKLAGIDKTQAAREDREATDVVAVWKGIVGRLRSAVAGANAALAKEGNGEGSLLKVPELVENMRVETVKGALTAPKACVVCGLKREERVVRVDFEVEDSFGEWWVEFWGHRECRNFWVEHEAALRSR